MDEWCRCGARALLLRRRRKRRGRALALADPVPTTQTARSAVCSLASLEEAPGHRHKHWAVRNHAEVFEALEPNRHVTQSHGERKFCSCKKQSNSPSLLACLSFYSLLPQVISLASTINTTSLPLFKLSGREAAFYSYIWDAASCLESAVSHLANLHHPFHVFHLASRPPIDCTIQKGQPWACARLAFC